MTARSEPAYSPPPVLGGTGVSRGGAVGTGGGDGGVAVGDGGTA